MAHFAFLGGGDFKAKRLTSGGRTIGRLLRRRLAFEPLEDRSLLSVCVWNGGSTVDSNWMTPANWADNAIPQPGDELQFSGTARTSTHNDFPAGTQFQSLDLAESAFTLDGNDLTLTDGISVASGATGSDIQLNVALAKPLTLDAASGTTLTISAALSGPNYLMKTGAGTLVLSAANSYTGGTDIEDGTLQVGNSAASALCGNGLLVNGQNAVLDLNGNNVTVGDVGLINGSITSSTTSASITATSYLLLNGTIDVDLHGTDAPLMKAVAGTVTLSGINDYTGLTTVYAGQLNLVGMDAWNPVLQLGGADIQDGKLIIDYPGWPPASPAPQVQADLTASYAATPQFSSGQIYSSTATSGTVGLGWTDDGTSRQLTVARAQYGDANLDGYVNLRDMSGVLSNWGLSGRTWQDGDFNYDGLVNLSDLSKVLSFWGQQSTPLPPQVVALAPLGAQQTTANNLQFVVVFNKEVSGVDATDFQLACSGTCGTIASVVPFSSSTAAYLVTVDNVLGHGTLGLNLIDDNTIVDANGAPLVGVGTDDGSFTGGVYTMTGPYAWDGGGSDGNWSTAANWVDDVLPPAGSALYFTGTPSENGCSDDRTGVAFQSIEFGSSGFTIAGTNGLPLSDGVIVDAGVSDATISMTVTANSPFTIDVADADASLTISALSGSGSLTKSGEGTLALTADTHSGATSVTAGTLLVGSLPSVFADSLQNGVTFNDMLSSAAVVGDPGDPGGTFAWTDPTGGSLSLDPDSGTLTWAPAADCQAGSYPVTVTYTHGSDVQTRAFTVNVSAADMPPVFDLYFPSDHPHTQWQFPSVWLAAPLGYSGSTSFAAHGGRGMLTYSLSGNPPPGAQIGEHTGAFTSDLGSADPFTVYDFYVTVTDTAGQFDRVHVTAVVNPSLASWAPDYPVNALAPSTCTVAPDSVNNVLTGPWVAPVIYDFQYVTLQIQTAGGWLTYDASDPIGPFNTPHGTVSFSANAHLQLRNLIYTPTPGFRGIDFFNYRWEYDSYYNGQLHAVTTNTATYAIQVGNWVNLVPHMTGDDVDKAVLTSARRDTATLTLENPRDDGLSVTGYWSLNFDRNQIRVYTSDGTEILPDAGGFGPNGSRFIETIAGYSSKSITLTVVGVSAATAELSANWNVWACHHDSPQPGQPGWEWSTTTMVGFSIFDADIDSDNNAGLYGGPDHTAQEEYLEDNPYGLGKIIIPNWGDADQDGIPDCWDGYGILGTYLGQDADWASASFVPMTVQIPAQIDPATATIQFDYNMIGTAAPASFTVPITDGSNGRIRIWAKDGIERRNGDDVSDDPQTSGDLIPTNQPLKVTDFGIGAMGGAITVYIEGVVEANFVHNYADVKAHDRPTNSIVVQLNPGNGGATVTDTVQYIVADTTSFYWHLQWHPELRAALASQGIYAREDLKKYCLQLLSFEQLNGSSGGFGFGSVDSAYLSSNDPTTGFGAGVYHDYISGNNLLTFKGTAGWNDWLNNIAQALWPPAAQYTTAMTIANDLEAIWSQRGTSQAPVSTPTAPVGWLVTGHSLGGGLAAAASIVSGFHAFTFNAAGVNYVTVQEFDTDNLLGLNINSQAQLQTIAQTLVTSYVVDGEILNYFQDNPWIFAAMFPVEYLIYGAPPQSIGTRVTLDSQCTIPLVPLELNLYVRYTLHSYYIESLLLSYSFPLS